MRHGEPFSCSATPVFNDGSKVWTVSRYCSVLRITLKTIHQRQLPKMWRRSGEGNSEIIFCQCDVSHPVDWSVDTSGHTVSSRPTFIFLKGSTQVDQFKGANKAYVLPPLISSIEIHSPRSGLENMIKKHATSTTTSFSGKGQTVGGEPVPPDVIGEVNNSLSRFWAHFSQLDPQFIVLAVLLGFYYVFWFV